MADGGVDSEIVSQFLLNTCRLRPQLNMHAIEAAKLCADVLMPEYPDDDVEEDFIPLITGSVAEFHIEPMLPFVSDMDVMCHCNCLLAIPQGHPPPTQLPVEFHNYVKVVEIVDSHFPGYVYLEARYLLTYCPDDEKYHCVEYDRGSHILCYLPVNSDDQSTVRHGPAAFKDNSDKSVLSVDVVHCCRCLVWPSQAADWPARQRNYGWPD